MDYSKGDAYFLSSITTTLHVGAHADSPRHYHQEGETIEQRSLNYYFGKCQVIHIDIQKKSRIRVNDLKNKEISQERVLFFTNTFADSNQWNEDFASLSVELVEYLDSKNVILVGIDTPSVDPANAKVLEAHHAIYQSNMAILEGVVLSEVPEGIYHLTALPLKIKGADASPVRAALFSL